MRKVTKIIVHCSDSDRISHDSIEVIRQWHTERGFTGPDGKPGTPDDVGYHFFIRTNGELELGRALGVAGAHTAGHNSDSVGVCLAGREKFSAFQFRTLEILVKWLRGTYGNIPVFPHRHFNKGKTCPNFDHSLFDV
jgi:N-acetylmuramoyl-L-alanine amidase